MNKIALALLAVAGLATSVAHAEHPDVRATIEIRSGGYAPVYATPVHTSGYWRDVPFQIWVAPHWETRCDRWGREIRFWAPGHYESRSRREWIAYGGPRHHDRGYAYGRDNRHGHDNRYDYNDGRRDDRRDDRRGWNR